MMLFFQILAGVFVACVGWFVAHSLNSNRNRAYKIRDIRLQYMIEAYRAFVDVNGRDLQKEHDYAKKLEAAVRDIQLFGSTSQVQKLHKAILSYKQRNDSTDEIVDALRDDLRIELNLPAVSEKVIWLVVDKNKTTFAKRGK